MKNGHGVRKKVYPTGGRAVQLVQRFAQALGVGPVERVKGSADIMAAEIHLRIEDAV